jgi:hypothetical protein
MTKLSIGMATYDDYQGTVFTCQSLALHHNLGPAEIIVVDNNPDSIEGRETRNYCEKRQPFIRYVPMPEATGTTQPRERIFAEARGEIVLAMDCHVLFAPGAIEKLLAWYDAHPESLDLIQGPLISDNFQVIGTHFDPVWRSEMHGTWGVDPRGADPDGEAFDIPGQGLGVFSCRREAWLGFNSHFRGFGGEEMYIHEKFRQAGRRTLCLPSLRWWHRFGRPGGAPYPLTRWNKVRNYVLGHNELGLPLDPIREHFVDSGRMSPEAWEMLIADPINATPPGGNQPRQPTQSPATIEALFHRVKNNPRDLDQHADAIRGLAGEAEHVTAFVKRREWNPMLAAGRPRELVVWQKEPHGGLQQLHEAIVAAPEKDGRKIETYTTHEGGDGSASLTAEIEPTDLLILDTVHSSERLTAELDRHADKCRRRILVRSTGAFGVKAEGEDAPGLFAAMRQFIEDNPEWFVARHEPKQWGWTLLSKDESDRPEQTIWPWPPGFGPGTELKKILSSVGIEPKPSCDCNGKMIQMDVWGVEECRENRDVIVGWLRDNADKWGWSGFGKAAIKSVATGLALKINPLKPYESLVDLAISNAEKAEQAKCGKAGCGKGKCDGSCRAK